MIASVGDSTFIPRFLPSLYHLSTVKVALPLFQNFDMKTIQNALMDNQFQNPSESAENSDVQETDYIRAKRQSLLIPPHLRKDVLWAVRGMEMLAWKWKTEHSGTVEIKEGKRIFHWKSDGTIDYVDTIQKLLLDETTDIQERFTLACIYCLEESILTLWGEMEASGETDCLDTAESLMVRFWVRWIREGCRVPWTQFAGECLGTPCLRSRPFIRYSAFFPSLRPQERRKFLLPLKVAALDDFLLCLSAMTKEEKEIVIRLNASRLILWYLKWPLQSLCVRESEKLWNYFDAPRFESLLRVVLKHAVFFLEEYDYYNLFLELWNSSPDRLKESAKSFKERIDSSFKIVRHLISEKKNEIKGKKERNEER